MSEHFNSPKGPIKTASLSQVQPVNRFTEFWKVLATQLILLTLSIEPDNWESKHKQIKYLLTTSPSHIRSLYIQQLDTYFASSLKGTEQQQQQHQEQEEKLLVNLSYIELILRDQLEYLKSDLDQFDKAFDKAPLRSNSVEFVSRTNCPFVLAAHIVLSHPGSATQEQRENWLKQNSSNVLIALRTTKFQPYDHWFEFFQKFLSYPSISFVDKLVLLGLRPDFQLSEDPAKDFYQQVFKMLFKDLIIQIGPDHILPDKLLPNLLQLKVNEVDDALALILAEVLIPGLQGLSQLQGGVTALTRVNNLPEAAAKGAQLQAALRSIDDPKTNKNHNNNSNNSIVNWYKVFSKIHENLFDSSKRSVQPLIASILQFLASLDFKEGLIDIFLSYDWWFLKTLLYILHSSEPSDGGFDITLSKNITLTFEEDDVEVQTKRNILRFINVGKLELQVMGTILHQQPQQQQISEQERKLNYYLSHVFDHDFRVFPEYLLVAALSMEKSTFVLDLIESLFTILMDSGSPLKVLAKIKEIDESLAIRLLKDYYIKRPSPEAISRILKLTTQLSMNDKLLGELFTNHFKIAVVFLLECTCWGFDIKPIVDSKLSSDKATFYKVLLEALDIRSTEDYDRAQRQLVNDDIHKVLSVPTVYYFIEKLKGAGPYVEAESLKSIQLLLLTTYPRLINFGTGHDAAILANGDANFFPQDVEQEMKSYYSKMYNKDMEIKEIVEILTRMKSSDTPHDQDVFACMIHSLLDEYRFFSEYPLTALASTSLLFGALLQKDLIQGTTLTVALNFIWELCNQPQDLHLFKFAVQLLYNFKLRLHEYPIYCKHLLECQSLLAHAKMYQIVKDAANGIPAVQQPSSSNTPIPEDYQSFAAPAELLGQEQPSTEIKDRLLFHLNNISSANFDSKIPEIRNILQESNYFWFANYLVSERAKTEPNNHELYAKLVDGLDKSFGDFVLRVTLIETHRLLTYCKDLQIERTNLKNLGSWLGKMTLAKNVPLKRQNIALKFLLVESYDRKTLSHVIPFVSKILDQAQYSTVFLPPNPWTLGVLSVLVELYEFADLKLNLKFEVEVLCNTLKIKILDIAASSIVRNHNPKNLGAIFGVQEDSLVNDLSRLALERERQSQLQVQAQAQAQQAQAQAQQQQQQQLYREEPQLDTLFANLVGNTIFTQNANLRRAFQALLSRAVRECAVPILSRVSEAVLITTESLVRKDFACEVDIRKLRIAYQSIAQRLAHLMVICSGRKILSETVEATMLQLLSSQVNPNDLPLGELELAIQENVDLCVDIVDKISSNNIAEMIEERMRRYVLSREQHLKTHPNEPYIEEGVSDYALKLPAPLGLPVGLSARQMQIYETFGAKGLAMQSAGVPDLTNRNGVGANVTGATNAGVSTPGMQNINVNAPSSAAVAAPSAIDDNAFSIFSQYCQKTLSLLADIEQTKLAELPQDHPIMLSLQQTLSFAQQNALKNPELLLRAAQYAVNCLFTQGHENPILNEIFVVILDKLCEYLPLTAKDVTWWLVHSLDQRKFNMPVIYLLLKVQLVQPVRLDELISRLIRETGNPSVVKFAINLIISVFQESYFRPIALRSEFGFTLDALTKFVPKDDEEKELKVQIDKLLDILATGDSGLTNLYAQMSYIYSEWVKLLSHGEDTKKLRMKFVYSLHANDILSNPEYFEVFFKAATEVSVNAFPAEHEIRTRTQRETFLAADCLAYLIVEIMLMFEKEKSDKAMEYLKNIMGVIMLVLTNDHEGKSGWNERAYFRIFLSLLCVWADASVVDEDATSHLDDAFYSFMGEIFHLLQPIIFPGFTFGWISLISHRMFLPKLLENKKIGYSIVTKLLSALLKFENVYGSESHSSNDVINVIFKAVTRVFVGIAHDYPEYLVECHYQLLNALPKGHVQLRNIILATTPHSVPFVDPFTQGLKMETLPAINDSPEVAYEPIEDLAKAGLKKPVENFLRIPAPGLMKNIYAGVSLQTAKEVQEIGFNKENYNIKLINALVMHIGISAISDWNLTGNSKFNATLAHASLLTDLANHGLIEFKYHLISAIANQLRYPNAHTHWFIGVILYFFLNNNIWGTPENKLVVQEIIVRILLERHIVSKPHPWGLTIVFTELVKNEQYGLFELPFVKSAPTELKTVFEALANNVKG